MSDFTLYHGDCLEVLAKLADNSMDSMVCDPPSSINFMGLHWDNDKGGRDKWIEWLSSIMKQCYRVLKPGGHAAVWALPRTSHWTGMALELAGFEVRDCISYLYDSGRDVQAFLETLSAEQRNMLEIILANGDDNFNPFLALFGSGFPKSLNVGRAIDQCLGMEREVVGKVNGGAKNGNGNNNDYGNYNSAISGEYTITAPASDEAKRFDGFGSALKPAAEYWWLVRKPLSEPTIAANVLKWGVGGINVDACRIPFDTSSKEDLHAIDQWERQARSGVKVFNQGGDAKLQDFSQSAPTGRFPANVIIDGSDPVEAEFAKAGARSSGARNGGDTYKLGTFEGQKGARGLKVGGDCESSTGSASRFFYCAKPSSRERNEGLEGFETKGTHRYGSGIGGGNDPSAPSPDKNIHPTVKSINLMKYLVTMLTPKGGTVLDCFMGSGSTGVAAMKSGFKFVGIEKERPYFEIAEARIRHANLGRQGEIIAPDPLPVKAKVKLQMEMF